MKLNLVGAKASSLHSDYVSGRGAVLDASNDQLEGPPQVNVLSHTHQRHAVWTGGSLLASMDAFAALCHTKAQYDECGPSICRQSRVLALN